MPRVIFLFLTQMISNSYAFAGSVDLLFCIESALNNSAEIREARVNFDAFKEMEKQGLASLLPTIGISVSRAKIEQERSDGGGFKIDQNYVTESDSISLRQPVYRPKLMKDYKKTKQQVSAERLLLLHKEDSLKMNVSEVYLKLLRAYEEQTLLEKRISLLAEQKKAAVKAIEAGRGTLTELAEINAANDKALADLIRAEQGIKLQMNELNFYTGESLSDVKKLDNDKNNFEKFDELNLGTWEERAVSNNFELQSKRETITVAKTALASEKLSRYPTLDLDIQISRGSSESTFFVDSETKTNSLGLTFFLPLYQGGSVSSRIRQSASLLDAKIEGLRFEEENLRKRVQRAYYGMQENMKLRDALKSAVKSAMIELEANKKSALVGVRKQLDILVSQQKLIRVEGELIDAKLNILSYWLNLNFLASEFDKNTINKANLFLQ